MKLLEPSGNMLGDFIAYCNRYGPEHDDSYLPDPEFSPGPDDPTRILVDDSGKVMGAASLLLTGFKQGRKGRFRILHAVGSDVESYRALLNGVLDGVTGIDQVFLFIPDCNAMVRSILEVLGFRIERYSFLLQRPIAGMQDPQFPAGFTFQALRPDEDLPAYCDLMNSAFAGLAGHVLATPERIRSILAEDDCLNGGEMVLWFHDRLIGAVRVTWEMDDSVRLAFIGGLAVHPDFQKNGLGRNLLRAGAQFGRQAGFKKVALSVNAENHHAVQLYLNEGFVRRSVVVCYRYFL